MRKSGSKTPKRDSGRRQKLTKSDGRPDNPLRHGLVAKKDLLPWESFTRYKALVDGLTNEYAPKGLIEEHLVHELGTIIRRKRRISPAESGVFYKALMKPSEPLIDENALKIGELAKRWAKEKKGNFDNIIESAMSLTKPDGDQPSTHIAASRNVDAEQLSKIARYEAHLDRKFQRILGMLISLQKARTSPESRVIEEHWE
jgi:hypothetical protein